MTDTDGATFEQWRPRLVAISRRIVGSEAEAEDIVQDCFLKWQHAGQAELAAPAAWLTTVVRHLAIDRLRKRGRDAVAALAASELAPPAMAPLPEDGLLRGAELAEALAVMLACLSPSERMALVLHEVFECGHADIAKLLGTRTENARQYLSRARRRLRERQAEPAPEEKMCRELLLRFQAAINGRDVGEMLMLLAAEQPVSVRAVRQQRGPCANDLHYRLALAA